MRPSGTATSPDRGPPAGPSWLPPATAATTTAPRPRSRRSIRPCRRRMLIVVEACEGGVLGQGLTAPGALLLSAANPTENLLSANYDSASKTWLADQFSYQLWQASAQLPNASVDDVYQHLYLNVEGSHVSAYGPRFGDARTVPLREFLTA